MTMLTHLERIIARTRVTLAERKRVADLPELERLAEAHQPRGFAAHLRKIAAGRPAIIAELKKASPSKGLLRADYRPAETAKTFEAAGAGAISVLTDGEFFQGSLDDLRAVSAVVAIPVLRKDFIVDQFQLLEARAAGADAVLLIVAAHADEDLRRLADEARSMSLDVLCEVHDGEELQRAVALGFETIGVNCRDLKTLTVHPERHLELAGDLPARVLRVAESGITGPDDVERLRQAGYGALLIGETLMRHADPAAQLRLLLGHVPVGEV